MAENEEGGEFAEEIEILKPSNVKIRRRTEKTYFSNPFSNTKFEYWLYEWIYSAQSWMEAFDNARSCKMLPGLYADNKAAAEYYIFARALRKEEGLKGKAVGFMYAFVGGWIFPPAYQLAKSPKTTKYIASLSDPRVMFKDDWMFPSPWEILKKTENFVAQYKSIGLGI